MEEVAVVDVVEEYLDPDPCWTDGTWFCITHRQADAASGPVLPGCIELLLQLCFGFFFLSYRVRGQIQVL